MTAGIIITSMACISYLYFGIYIFLVKPSSSLNRTFLYFCICFAQWNLTIAFLFADPSPEFKDLLLRFEHVGSVIYVMFVFIFFMKYTNYESRIPHRKVLYLLLWLIPAVLVYQSLVHNAISLSSPNGFWFIFRELYSNLALHIVSMLVIIHWAYCSKLKRNYRQAAFIIIGGFLPIILNQFTEIIRRDLGYPTFASSLSIIWMGSLFFTMIRYRFLYYSSETISRDVVKTIDESVFVVDIEGSVIFSNDKTRNPDETHQSQQSLTDYFVEHRIVEKQLELLLKNNFSPMTCRLHLHKAENPVLINACFSAMFDEFNEPLGLIITASEVIELHQLRKVFNLTEREIFILQFMISGETNTIISDYLEISINTLKRHIGNIYNKMNINSRVELMKLLLKFNITPQ